MTDYFEGVQYFQILMLHCAERGDWGSVYALMRTCRRAREWVNTADGQKLVGWRGAKKMLLNAFGVRKIDFPRNRIIYTQRGVPHRVNGPAIVHVSDFRPRRLVLSWYLHGVSQKVVEIPITSKRARLNKLVTVTVPESLQLRHKHESWIVETTLGVYRHEYMVAKHHLETEQYVTFSASNAAIFDPSIRVDLSSSSSSSSTESDAKDDPIGLKFFASAYDAIDEADKQMREKRRARSLQKRDSDRSQQSGSPAVPKKRRLVRRDDDSD